MSPQVGMLNADLCMVFTCRAIEKLQNGRIKMTEDDLPAFLWKGNGASYDPHNMHSGLFCGFFLEWVSCLSFYNYLLYYRQMAGCTTYLYWSINGTRWCYGMRVGHYLFH